MIAPRTTLLVLTAVVLFPLSLLGAVAPGIFPAAIVVVAALLLVTVLDGLVGLHGLDGIDASLPDRAQFSKDRPGTLSLTITLSRPRRLALRAGIAFPNSFDCDETRALRLGGEHGRHLAEWPCTPRERGRFPLARVHLEVPSPLRLWSVRAVRPAACVLRVYPNVLEERRKMAALFLNREDAGVHARRQVGKGREFEQLREYLPGDNYEDIHWKATARRGVPVTKTYQIERTQEVYVIVDASRLSARKLPGAEQDGDNQLERFLTAALLLGLVAEQQGDLYGMLSFSDGVHDFVRARKGRSHFNACRDALHQLQPRAVNPDFEEVTAFLGARLRRRALLLFLTNLDDPVLAETFVKNVQVLNRRHLVFANLITPGSVRPLFSTPRVQSLDDIYAHLGGHLQWRDLRELRRNLKLRGVSLGLLNSSAFCADLVSQYMRVKQRQLI